MLEAATLHVFTALALCAQHSVGVFFNCTLHLTVLYIHFSATTTTATLPLATAATAAAVVAAAAAATALFQFDLKSDSLHNT
jgi:hypothetical protein